MRRATSTHLNLRMITNTGEYTLAHARQNSSRILGSLINAELDILFPQEEGSPSEQSGGSLRAYTGPGTPLREEQRDGFIREAGLRWERHWRGGIVLSRGEHSTGHNLQSTGVL